MFVDWTNRLSITFTRPNQICFCSFSPVATAQGSELSIENSLQGAVYCPSLKPCPHVCLKNIFFRFKKDFHTHQRHFKIISTTPSHIRGEVKFMANQNVAIKPLSTVDVTMPPLLNTAKFVFPEI